MNAEALKHVGRDDWQPFRLSLGDTELALERCLRLLPGKRMACQASHDGTPVFAKLCFSVDHRKSITAEADNLRRLSAAGVRVPAIIGVFERPAVTVLLLEWLPEAVPLGNMPVGHWSQALAADFCRQLDHMFAASLVQIDLHLDNFVVAPAGVYVVDAGKVEVVSGLSARRRRDNLGLLCAQAVLADQARLVALVLEHLQSHVDSEAQLRAAIHGRLMQRIRHANGKWLRDCTAVHAMAAGNAHYFFDRSFGHSFDHSFDRGIDRSIDRSSDHSMTASGRGRVRDLLDNPAAAECLKEGSRVSVYRDDAWVIKHYRQASWKTRIKQLLGIHPAQRSWRFGWTWDLLGLSTPRPVGLKLNRDGTAVLVFPFQAGERYSEILEYQRDTGARLRPALEQDLAAMGRAHLWHGDVKAQNILVADDHASWIDLDAAGWSKRKGLAGRRHQRDVQRFARNWQQFVDRSHEVRAKDREEGHETSTRSKP